MRAALLTLLLALLATTFARPVLASPRTEGAAKAALKKAEGDYLAMNYGTGATRIEKAMKACGTNRCSASIRAALFRDLGTMQFRKGDKDQAGRNWAAAVQLQGDITLNPAYDAPDIRKAFQAAANGAGGGGGAAGGGGGGGGGGGDNAEQPAGDFNHTPAGEQKTDTPLPVYVEGGGDNLVRVVLKYKGAGQTSWKRIDLKKMGDGWGGLIPCGDVHSGTMRYYVQGFDDSKEAVASNGDARHPYTVPIKDDISGDAPHLPGKAAPKSCHESSDCPPDFPGCSKSGEAAGDEGDDNGDKSDDDSDKGPKGPYRKVWIGIAGALEFQSMPAGKDLCHLDPTTALPANSANVYCTNQDGTDFPTRSNPNQNAALSPGSAGSSNGGVDRGDIRLMLSFDYALSANMLLGARLGLTTFKYPGQAAYTDGRAWSAANGRLYVDARFSYLFGDQAITKTVAPMLYAGLGLASFDTHTDSGVTLNGGQVNAQNGTVQLWQMNGPFFLMIGGGIHVAFSERFGGTLTVRANGSFGSNGFVPSFGPEAGLAYGF
ncbi:MAG TPA: hypothetical protein VGG39_30810 [Polyangiaceae bacterium]